MVKICMPKYIPFKNNPRDSLFIRSYNRRSHTYLMYVWAVIGKSFFLNVLLIILEQNWTFDLLNINNKQVVHITFDSKDINRNKIIIRAREKTGCKDRLTYKCKIAFKNYQSVKKN